MFTKEQWALYGLIIPFGIICLILAAALIPSVSVGLWLPALIWMALTLGAVFVLGLAFHWLPTTPTDPEYDDYLLNPDPGKIIFCEGYQSGWVKQPISTWSDLAFIAAGLAVILIAGTRPTPAPNPMADPASLIPLGYALVLAFAAEMKEHFVGLRNHELIGLGLGAALLIHFSLHWQWVVSLTKTFVRNLLHGSRLNYVLNLTLLVDFVVIVATGIIISRTLGLNLNVEGEGGCVWQQIHILAAELSLLLVGLHVALHWKWIASHAKQYLFRFRLPLRRAAAVSTSSSRSTASRRFVRMVVFIIIVAVSGLALAANGNMRNPFSVVTEIANMVTASEQSALPAGEVPANGERPARPEGGFEGGGPDDQTSIQWSAVGGVLFNLWFIAAAAAFVMVIGRPVKFVLRPLRRRPRMAARSGGGDGLNPAV